MDAFWELQRMRTKQVRINHYALLVERIFRDTSVWGQQPPIRSVSKLDSAFTMSGPTVAAVSITSYLADDSRAFKPKVTPEAYSIS